MNSYDKYWEWYEDYRDECLKRGTKPLGFEHKDWFYQFKQMLWREGITTDYERFIIKSDKPHERRTTKKRNPHHSK